MVNFDVVTGKNKIKHKPNWPYIPYYPHKIIKIGGSQSGKTNTLFNLINQ